MEAPEESDITIPLKPVASPSRESTVSVPQPLGTTDPVKEKPSTVEPPADTVKPAEAASPPETPTIEAPSTLN